MLNYSHIFNVNPSFSCHSYYWELIWFLRDLLPPFPKISRGRVQNKITVQKIVLLYSLCFLEGLTFRHVLFCNLQKAGKSHGSRIVFITSSVSARNWGLIMWSHWSSQHGNSRGRPLISEVCFCHYFGWHNMVLSTASVLVSLWAPFVCKRHAQSYLENV